MLGCLKNNHGHPGDSFKTQERSPLYVAEGTATSLENSREAPKGVASQKNIPFPNWIATIGKLALQQICLEVFGFCFLEGIW